jgi:hypothetical protein
MTTLLRIFGVAIIVFLLTVEVFILRYVCDFRGMQTVIHQAEELEQLHEAVLHLEQSQHQAVQEWIAQRCTLAQTMQRFQELEQEMDQTSPAYTRKMRKISKLPDEERHYLLIRERVESILHDRPGELALALRPLERDYQQLQAGSPKRGNALKDTRARKGAKLQESAGAQLCEGWSWTVDETAHRIPLSSRRMPLLNNPTPRVIPRTRRVPPLLGGQKLLALTLL